MDWAQPLSGQQTVAAAGSCVSQWTSYNPLYVWPKLESGVLRMTCAHIAHGPLLQTP